MNNTMIQAFQMLLGNFVMPALNKHLAVFQNPAAKSEELFRASGAFVAISEIMSRINIGMKQLQDDKELTFEELEQVKPNKDNVEVTASVATNG